MRGLKYVALGLAGEAGEVANKVKKIDRDDDEQVTEEAVAAILEEVGDVLWYASQLAEELGTDFSLVAEGNLDKLLDRKERGVIGGSGDKR